MTKLWLVLGFVGVFVFFFGVSLCYVAAEADRQSEEMYRKLLEEADKE